MNNDHKLFSYFSIFWIILAWIGFIATLSGFFYKALLLPLIILGIFFFFYLLRKDNLFQNISLELKIFSIASIIIISLFSYFTVPTIFSGRDQGSISESAIRISQNHNLTFSNPVTEEFFKIYGPGKALNFPGFYYQKDGGVITQFPIAYSSWLAIFYSIFGLTGFAIANGITLFIFAISIFLISKELVKSSKLLPFLVFSFVFVSFLFSWIIKMTLTENIALALIWFGILQFILFFKNPTKENLLFSFLSFGLLMFARIEGIAIFLIFFTLAFWHKKSRQLLSENKKPVFIAMLALPLIAVTNFILDINFYREIAKAILKSNPIISKKETHIFSIFFAFGILPFTIFGAIEIIKSIYKKNYLVLLPFLLVLPTFVYLLNPNISIDQPWMLRRFIFSIIPVFILYSIVFVNNLFLNADKKIAIIVILAILTSNIPALTYFSTFSENAGLLKQTKELSQRFSSKDLILLDQEATGSGWSMISGPMNFLLNKNSAYFFNINDLEKIDRSKFEKIYLIVPEKNISRYSESNIAGQLHKVDNYTFTTTGFIDSEHSLFPDKALIQTNGTIFEIY